jgi:hypothetical protein
MAYNQTIKKSHFVQEPFGLPRELQPTDKFYTLEEEKELKNHNVNYELEPEYDRRKSFYGKAVVTEKNGKKVLTSYSTDVAEIENGKAKVHGTYSDTTLRHIKEFLKQNGFKAESSKQIMKDYGDKN